VISHIEDGCDARQFSVVLPAYNEHNQKCNFHLRTLPHRRSSPEVANIIACFIIGSRIDYCNWLYRAQTYYVGLPFTGYRFGDGLNLGLLYSVTRQLNLVLLRMCEIIYDVCMNQCDPSVLLVSVSDLFLTNDAIYKFVFVFVFVQDLLIIPRTGTSFGRRRFSVAGPRIRNWLPHELKQASLFPCFNSHIKTQCNGTQGNAVPSPPILSTGRSLTQGNGKGARGNACNRSWGYCAEN